MRARGNHEWSSHKPRSTNMKAVSSYLKLLKAQMTGLMQYFTQELQIGSEKQNGAKKKINRREKKHAIKSKLYTATLGDSVTFLAKLSVIFPYNPATRLPHIYLNDLKNLYPYINDINVYKSFIHNCPKLEAIKHSSIDKGTGKLWHIHTTKCNSEINLSEFSGHKKTWKNLKCSR